MDGAARGTGRHGHRTGSAGAAPDPRAPAADPVRGLPAGRRQYRGAPRGYRPALPVGDAGAAAERLSGGGTSPGARPGSVPPRPQTWRRGPGRGPAPGARDAVRTGPGTPTDRGP